jgi:hypothetical protein
MIAVSLYLSLALALSLSLSRPPFVSTKVYNFSVERTPPLTLKEKNPPSLRVLCEEHSLLFFTSRVIVFTSEIGLLFFSHTNWK